MLAGFITAAQPITSVTEMEEHFCPGFDQQKWRRIWALICDCCKDEFNQFFGSRFDQLMWSIAYVGLVVMCDIM